jgi:hypothetical protein
VSHWSGRCGKQVIDWNQWLGRATWSHGRWVEGRVGEACVQMRVEHDVAGSFPVAFQSRTPAGQVDRPRREDIISWPVERTFAARAYAGSVLAQSWLSPMPPATHCQASAPPKCYPRPWGPMSLVTRPAAPWRLPSNCTAVQQTQEKLTCL